MFNAEEMNKIAYEKSFLKVEVEREIDVLAQNIERKANGGDFELNNAIFDFHGGIDYEKACVIVNKVRDYFEDKGFGVELRLRGFGYDDTPIGEGYVSYSISWKEV